VNLAELCAALAEKVPEASGEPEFPSALLGAFRRKSITFCTGQTDERTPVWWFQSRGFTIDLRLPDGPATPVAERQGWIGDTLWNADRGEMSWRIARGYQPHDQWPEPARFHFIGNSVLEFAPSAAYVEDWRQQSVRGPLLGLRLSAAFDVGTGEPLAMDGGLILAGEHAAFALSRRPAADRAVSGLSDLRQVLAAGEVTAGVVEDYEVSVALGSEVVNHSTQPWRLGQPIVAGAFTIEADGSIDLRTAERANPLRLRFTLDTFRRDFAFLSATPTTPAASRWLASEGDHLARHAAIVR
jgi:hypothetical protein